MDSAETLISDLSPDQRDAVCSTASPLAIVAAAGSGKTRVLTRRIAHRIAIGETDPRHILAVTFTRRAAEELRRRLHNLGISEEIAAGTFHSIAYAQLRRYWIDHDIPTRSILVNKLSFLRRITEGTAMAAFVTESLAHIDWAGARGIEADLLEDVLAVRANSLPASTRGAIVQIYKLYSTEKRKRGVLDFDDILRECTRTYEYDPDFAHAQRWRFRHIYVDEVQDINPVQINLLRAWLGDSNDLCVVGDPRQAIYGWNGSDPTFLSNFTTHFPTSDVQYLSENFRSVSTVLDAAHPVLPIQQRQLPKPTAARSEGTYPRFSEYDNDATEIDSVIDKINEFQANGVPLSDIAVLARTNKQLAAFSAVCDKRGVDRKGRKGASTEQSYHQTLKTIGAAATTPIQLAQAFHRLTENGKHDHRQCEQLVELANEFAALDPAGNADAFRDWLRTSTTDERDSASYGISLLTFHRSKGLEFHVVFVIGAEAGYVPIPNSDSDEERRLLYVAMTRAADHLFISAARERTFGSKISEREVSPYLSHLDVATPAAQESTDWRTALAEARARLKTE